MSLFKKIGDDFSKMRVLLADDNEFDFELARAALYQLGFRTVLEANDGKEAYELIEKFPNIELIISDWNMPTLNGLDFLRIVHHRWPGVPFVMLTSNDRVEQVAEARQAGVFAYILKPYTLEHLEKKIIGAIRMRLAMGGDKADNDDQVYIRALANVEAVTETVREDETSSIPPEIERLENSVEAVLFSGKDKTKQLSEFRNASYAVANQANLDTDRHFLIEAILGHLNEFMAELGVPNPVQLEVVKLHVESIIAVSGGQEFKAGNLKENPLLQGLRMAAEKARET